jgi:hypothetical protein
MISSNRFRGGLLAAALALLSPAALAGINWQFGGTSGVTSSGVTVTPTALAFTGGTNNDQLANATLYFYSGGGLGVSNADCCIQDPNEGLFPEHSVDNNGRVDLVLFSFNQAVNLQSVTLGWRAFDSDLSILAFNGSTLPGMIGNTASQLVGQGWKLIGNYNGPTASSSGDSTDVTINTGTSTSSKFWIVSAYDSRWPLSSGMSNPSGLVGGDDYVKILALYGDKPSNGVPEPHALLLLGLAMVSLWATRRGQQVTA